MRKRHKIPSYFVVTEELKCSGHETLKAALKMCNSFLKRNEKFILLDSASMELLLKPEELTSETFKGYNDKYYLVKLGLAWSGKPEYTIHQFNYYTFDQIYSQPMSEYSRWLGYFSSPHICNFESFTQKFAIFNDLLLNASEIIEELLWISRYEVKEAESALLLDREAAILNTELNRLILNPDYDQLRNQLRKQEDLEMEYENPTLEDLASNFGSFSIDPDSLYDKD